MTTITWPAGVVPDTFALRLSATQRVHASPFGGSEQVVDLLNDRWMISMSLPKRTRAQAAAIEAFINAMRGMTNTVNLYHFGRKTPRGTMVGSPTCNAASQGAASVTLASAGAGATLLAGDMIGVSGQLLQVAADATANGSGVITVTLVNRLRAAITGGSAVTWDRPTVPFRLVSSPAVLHVPGYAESVSLDFAEVIS
jgi:hypothetical protein